MSRLAILTTAAGYPFPMRSHVLSLPAGCTGLRVAGHHTAGSAPVDPQEKE